MNSRQFPPSTPVLRLVRHAPVDGAEGVCYGASDWPADAAANEALAGALAQQLPQRLYVAASPLRRCRRLALALQARRPDLAFEIDPRLQEFDFGAWEGRRWAEIDRHAVDHWLADFWHRSPAAGAETMAAFMSRVAAAWSECRARATNALWITHAGVIRAALVLERGVRCPMDASQWPSDAIRSGTIYAVRLDQLSSDG